MKLNKCKYQLEKIKRLEYKKTHNEEVYISFGDHQKEINCISINHKNNILASCSSDCTIKL